MCGGRKRLEAWVSFQIRQARAWLSLGDYRMVEYFLRNALEELGRLKRRERR